MQTQTQATEKYMLVVHAQNAKGKQVRRIKIVKGTYDNAWQYANDNANKLFAGLKKVFFNVVPK